jgi:predicted MFS family arabinose efflux permease
VTTGAIFLFVLLGLCALLPMKLDAGFGPPPSTANLFNQFSVLRRDGPRRLLLITLAVNVAVATTYGLKSIMLIDAGFAVSDAGLIALVGTCAAGMLGALATRYLVEHFGGYWVTSLLAGTLGISCFLFGLLIGANLNKEIVIALLLVNSFMMVGLIPAIKSILLGYCSDGRKATDFSVFSGIEALAFLIVVSGSSAIVDVIGFSPILAGAGCVSIGGAVMAWRRRQETAPTRLMGRPA